MRADGKARGGRLAVKATITGLPQQPFTLDAELPVAFSASPFAFDLPSNKPIKARLDGAADLALLSSIMPIGEARLSGRAQIALGVDGTLAAPKAAGTVTLADGRYENLLTGTLVDKIALRVIGDGSTVAIETLSATDGSGGKLSGSGRVALTPEGAGKADAKVHLDKFAALRLDEAQATVSGDLTLAGTPAHWLLGRQGADRPRRAQGAREAARPRRRSQGHLRQRRRAWRPRRSTRPPRRPPRSRSRSTSTSRSTRRAACSCAAAASIPNGAAISRSAARRRIPR